LVSEELLELVVTLIGTKDPTGSDEFESNIIPNSCIFFMGNETG
jgi:hypothetical protein